jgi:predicted TIM-barrel fold metal-dependent hydrolase
MAGRLVEGMKVKRKVFDAHNHIGFMIGWKYYGVPEEVSPTIYNDDDRSAKIDLMDTLGVDRSMVFSNYGIPDPKQPFELNPVTIEAVDSTDTRLLGGIWFSPSAKLKEQNVEALKLAGSTNIKVLKATCLLGGTWDCDAWDDEHKQMWKDIVDVAKEHDYIMHLHTSPGGGSDVSKCLKWIRHHGKDIKVHIVHCGGGVSGHIKLIPEFMNLIREGYPVTTDFSWAVGFAQRFMFDEIEKQGIGDDRIMFASDEPWSDFWSEYYKLEGLGVSDELKNKMFYDNAEKLYGV